MTQSWVNHYWYILVLLGAWDIVWKALGLWKSARKGDKAWFVLILILNTVGILPMAYIYIFSKRQAVKTDGDR
jgi:hypothetical protein